MNDRPPDGVYYALAMLAEGKRTLKRLCESVTACRGGIEKHLPGNRDRAADLYAALQHDHGRLIESVKTCRRFLLEIGEDEPAAYAGQLCGLSVWSERRGAWVTKYDGADDSDIEPVKGGLSDSMKRAAVQWGIGRYLYGMGAVFVATERHGSSAVIAKSEQSKLDRAHQEHVAQVFGVPQPIDAVPPDNTTAMPGLYVVVATAALPSVKRGRDTALQLRDGAGRVIQVNLLGENESLIPGVWISNAHITRREKNGIVYLILESFDICNRQAA